MEFYYIQNVSLEVLCAQHMLLRKKSTLMQHVLINKSYNSLLHLLSKFKMFGVLQAVSYTHLDVYKRQL